MIRLKRYIKYNGELIGPGKELQLSSELEDKHVKSGAAEYIMPNVSEYKKEVEEIVAEDKKPAKEISVQEEENGKEAKLQETERKEINLTTAGEEIENEEEADVNDLVPEDVSINFDEDEYASGSKKKRKK